MNVRRGTLAEGPLGNALPPSSIPVPTSAMKKASVMGGGRLGGSRMSMLPASQANGGPPTRVSSSSGGGGGGGQMARSASQENLNGRRSTVSKDGGVMSGARGDGGMYGRASQGMRQQPPGSVRRTSVYPAAGRQSVAPSHFNLTAAKDTRPIRDRTFIASCTQNVLDYLTAHRCPVSIHNRLLVSPTQKEFQMMFKFLLQQLIEPGQVWTGKKFEDDAIAVMKDLKYPSMEAMGRTALTAPGTGNVWPALLAMLNWLVELCKAHDMWRDPELVNDPLLIPPQDLPLDHPHLEDLLFWDFSARTYSQWFDEGAEDFPEAEAALEEMYEKLAQSSTEGCEQLESQVQRRRVELQQLQVQEPPLKQLEADWQRLMSDKNKFLSFISLLTEKKEKLHQTLVKMRLAMADQERQLRDLRAELNQIETAVAAQNLSPEEVTRMNHERETLSRNLEDFRTKSAEASQFSYDQEMQVTKSMDRFESLVADYTSLGHTIGTIPPHSAGLATGPNGVDFNIDLELGMMDLGEVQTAGQRLKQTIWPELVALDKEFRKQLAVLQNRKIELDGQHDQLNQKIESLNDEWTNKNIKLGHENQAAEDKKNSTSKMINKNNRAVHELETEIVTMSTQTQESVVQAETQLENLRIQFSEMKHKTAYLQDSLTKELMSHVDIIIKAREHVANSLKGVRSFAEAQ